MRQRILAFILGAIITAPLISLAQDWYQATGVPVARSLLNSADLRTEFSSIQTDIADKLPTLTGNGGKLIVVNSGGTALEASSSGLTVAQGGTGATTLTGLLQGNGTSAFTAITDSSTAGEVLRVTGASTYAWGALDLADGDAITGDLPDGNLSSNVPLLNGTNSFSGANTFTQALTLNVDLALTEGGTGASTASGARTSLGVAIGSDVQAYDADLSAIAALANTDSNFIVGTGATWTVESGATARTSLGLGSLATSSSINDGNWSGTDLAVANGGTGSSTAANARTALGVAIGSDVQAYDADLTTLGGLAKTDSNFIVGNGAAWVAESGATARTSLGLGSLATASSINNGNWSGTDLALGNGGTGASTASAARSNLGIGGWGQIGTVGSESIGSNQNNWSPASLTPGAIIRVTATTTSLTISGIDASGFSSGDAILIINVGANTFTILDDSSSSTAANRVLCVVSEVLATDEATLLWYDGTSSRWRTTYNN